MPRPCRASSRDDVSRPGLPSAALVRLGELTNRTLVLPMVIFYPTSRCNSRCLSCDWWRSSGADDLTLLEVGALARALPPLGTKLVVFSGGEPLLRPDLFDAARLFRVRGMMLHLLTSGVLLERCATEVASTFSRVIVSLDAAGESLYHTIRGVAALAVVERGEARLRRIAPDVPVTARATITRLNYRELPRLVEHAKALALDGISFLPADVSSSAFGRDEPPVASRLVPSTDEAIELRAIVEETISTHAADFDSGFIAESPEKLRRLPQYYLALNGSAPFPPVSCNAPWVSVVVEADGSVRPCFFHQPIGSIRKSPLDQIVTSQLPAFRRGLDMALDPVCVRCVCSMRTSWRSGPWRS
jgi:MoaA/NifB/PqqE/SkfB family radical SAM enzyme